MSMILGLTALSDENVRKVLIDPPLIWKIVAPDDPDIYEDARREEPRTSLLGRIINARREPQTLSDDGDPLTTDLDKAWHGIHYLLTGDPSAGPPPLCFLLDGGASVGDIEVGYGPARVFTSEQTRAIHEALAGITDEELNARFDSADMLAKEIYPEIWDRQKEEDDALGYLMDYVSELRDFLAEATRRRLGMVISIT